MHAGMGAVRCPCVTRSMTALVAMVQAERREKPNLTVLPSQRFERQRTEPDAGAEALTQLGIKTYGTGKQAGGPSENGAHAMDGADGEPPPPPPDAPPARTPVPSASSARPSHHHSSSSSQNPQTSSHHRWEPCTTHVSTPPSPPPPPPALSASTAGPSHHHSSRSNQPHTSSHHR